jgi:hypothetical protein
MIIIDPAILSDALRDLRERSLINLITGTMKWSQIIEAIEDGGLNNCQLALHLGEGRSTIHRWKNGAKPNDFIVVCRVLMVYAALQKGIKLDKRIPDGPELRSQNVDSLMQAKDIVAQ